MKEYNRREALRYAKEWAYKRNPKYYNFDPVGGDCTSFVSQCIYAGAGIMIYSAYGWYYRSGNDKSASWSGVEYLHKFLINNKQKGPYGRDANLNELEKGDLIQLSFDGNIFGHTLIITDISNGRILIASHTDHSYNRDLQTYNYRKARGIKIEGVRTR